MLGGAGRRKLAWWLAISLIITLIGTVVGTIAGLAIGNATEKGGGEWRGLGVLFVAFTIGAGCFFVLLIGSMWWLTRTGRLAFDRAPRSTPLLIVGFTCLIVSLGSLALIAIHNTPSLVSNEHLVERVGQVGGESEERRELVKRGLLAVPAIIAELHRHPYKKTREDESIELISVNPLLHVLGSIGGLDATTEIKRWTAQEVPSYVRVVALEVLAEAGDRSVLPAVVEMLEKTDGADWEFRRTELFNAIGVLKAGEHVGLIRTAMIGEPAKKHGYLPFDTVLAGVSALVAIDSDEAWVVLGELCAATDKSLRTDSIRALERSPGKRTIALLAKLLDNPDNQIQQTVFAALLRVDPNLLGTEQNTMWNEVNATKLREELKNRADK